MLRFILKYNKQLLFGAAALVLVTGAVSAARQHTALVAARAELSYAQRDVRQAQAVAASAEIVASQQRAAAEAARVESIAAGERAAEARREAASARAAYVALRDQTPTTPLTSAADAALEAAEGEATELRAALRLSHDALSGLQVALDTTSAALRLLRASTANLDAAASGMERASRPRLLARLKPRLGAGLAFGVDATGQPRLIAGISYGIAF